MFSPFRNQKRLPILSITILFSPIFFTGLSLIILDLQQASYISQTVVYDAALYYGLETNPLRRTTETWACDGLWDCAERLCRFSLLSNVSWIAFRALPSNDNETCEAITDERMAHKLFGGSKYKSITSVMLTAFIIQLLLLFVLFGLMIYPDKLVCGTYAFFLLALTVLMSVCFILWMQYSSRMTEARGDYPPPYVVSKLYTLNVLILITIFTLPILVLVHLFVQWKLLNINSYNDAERMPINVHS